MMNAPVVISATAKHTASVIFLHGLGDTGHGWASSLEEYRLPHIKYICPTASTKPVTLNNGFPMPSWFDLTTLSPDGPEDAEGIKKASDTVKQMITDEESKGIPSNRIVIGGFSQGGALAIYSALTYNKPLAGIIALSCWLPLNNEIRSMVTANKETPLMQCHGSTDSILPYKWGKLSHDILKTFMPKAELKTYAGLCHSSSSQELNDVKEFLEKVVPQSV